MQRLLARMAFLLAVIVAFLVSGWLASSIAHAQESLLTGTAIFGVSFFSLLSGVFKFWYELFY